jgi:mono/diheme cytochrome c family protein
MKLTIKFISILSLLIAFSCGEKEKKESYSLENGNAVEETKKVEPVSSVKASERIDLTNKGVGPVKSLTLPAEIDPALVAQGQEVYNKMCTACHKPNEKFIGPPPVGVLERRSPEWVMNMILNPEVMIVQDPLAKDLLMEFNGAPMANQNLTEDQARAILEYFRTLK